MSYCINPNCQPRQNPDDVEHCQACGTQMLINERYRLVQPLRELRKSPYVEVFEVEDCTTLREQGTSKVLKILKDNNDTLVRLFEREAQVLIWLRHPGIPKVEPDGYFPFLPSNSSRELHCLVMERIEGQDLEQWVEENGPISQVLALEWLSQLVEILDLVHQNRLLHRDIKPSNIMRRPNNQLVLIDFGTAGRITTGGGGTVVYSHGYTPQEQVDGNPAIPQSDFFALGRTFVHLLTNRRPRQLLQDSQTKQLIWRDNASQISPWLANLVDELMAPSVEDRPQNTETINQRIENPSRKRGPWVIAGLALVLLMGTLLWWFFFRPSSSAPLLQHEDDVNAVAFSPSGQYLATASLDNTARLWKVPGGEPVGGPLPHNGNVVAVAFSPKTGKYLATASLDGTVLVRNMTNGTINTLKDEGGIIAIAFSPSEQFLATANANGTGQVWRIANELPIAPLEHDGAFIRTVTFSRNGKYLATADLSGSVKMWEMPEVVQVGPTLRHQDGVLAVAFSPSGQYLATASLDNTARLWKVPGGEPVGGPLPHSDSVVAVTFSPKGDYLATLSLDNVVRVWNTLSRSSEIWKKFKVNPIAFSSNWKYLAAAMPEDDNAIHVWRLEGKGFSPKEERVCPQHPKQNENEHLAAITFSNENYLATASWDNTARLMTQKECNQ